MGDVERSMREKELKLCPEGILCIIFGMFSFAIWKPVL